MDGASTAQRQRTLDGVVAELAAERAASLAKAVAKLESTLATLNAVDAASADAHGRATRRTANALWELVVHREACGIATDVSELARDYGLPQSVVSRMGPYRDEPDPPNAASMR